MDFKEALAAMNSEPEIVEDAEVPATPDPFDLDKLKNRLVTYQPHIEDLVLKTSEHQIIDSATNVTAVEMAGQLSKLRGNLETARKSVIAPYDEIVRGINAMVREMRSPIDTATKKIKAKIAGFAREQAEIQRRIAEKKAKEEAEKRRKEMEKKRAEALERQRQAEEAAAKKQAELDALAEKEGVESVTVEVEEVEIPEVEEVVVAEVKTGPIQTDVGTASMVHSWKYEIEDFEKIPREYIIMKVDDKRVKEEIEAGCRAIPGLRIYEHTDVRVRTK